MNAFQLLSARFDQSRNSLFFTTLEGQHFTYAEYWGLSRRLAEHWKSQGCKPGDVIAFLLPNGLPLLCGYLSCALGGFVACPIPPTHHPDLIERLLALVSPALVVRDVPSGSFRDRAMAAEFSIEVDPQHPFFISFTSGMTGEPKAICHSLHNIIGSADAFASLTGMHEGTKLYHVFPMAYMAGILNAFFSPLMAGASIVEGPMFSPAAVLDFLERPLAAGVNTLSLTPTIASALCRVYKKNPRREEIRSQVTQVQCTSAPIPEGLREEFLESFGLPLRNCYGMTELGGPLTFESEEDAKGLRNWGVPLPVLEISLRGPEGQDLWIKSPYSMLGYLEKGRLTAPYDPQGFLDTGDLAQKEGEKIRITGRKKDIIIRGGVNVSPARVEAVLEGVEGVEEVAVVGAPHPFWGEVIVACVIPAVGHPDLATQVSLHGRGHLSPHERPDHVVLMKEFPRSFIGKLERKKLRETVSGILSQKAQGDDHSNL